MRKTKKRRRGSGTAGIMIIVLAFLVVMTVQICRIRSKDAEYAAKEKELQQQYEEETERSTEIDDLETYMSENFYENHRKSDRICVIVCVYLSLENNFLEVYHAYRTMENNGDRIADRKNDLCSIRAGGKYVMYHGILSGGAGILHGMLSG